MDADTLTEIDKLLFCSKCIKKLTGKIFHCKNHHNFCSSCNSKFDSCSVCQNKSIGRNLTLENISSLLIKNKLPTETIVYGPENHKHQICKGPVQGKGRFPCRFANCKESLPICRLLNHIRNFHLEHLIETTKIDLNIENYNQTLKITCESSSIKALHVGNVGLFFLIIDVAEHDLGKRIRAWFQLAAPNAHTKRIRYVLQLDYMKKYLAKFTDIPHSVRRNPKSIMNYNGCLVLDIPFELVQSDQTDEILLNIIIKKNEGVHRHKTITKVKKMQKEMKL